MHIRQACPVDDAALARLHIASWRAAYQGLIPSTFLESLEEEPRILRWRSLIEEQSSDLPQVLVAIENDEMVGFTRVNRTRDSDLDKSLWGEIEAIYVHPDRWGSGYGTALLDMGAEVARASGLSRLSLWVLTDNQQARAFYAHCGWEPEGQIKTDTSNGFPLHQLRYRFTL